MVVYEDDDGDDAVEEGDDIVEEGDDAEEEGDGESTQLVREHAVLVATGVLVCTNVISGSRILILASCNKKRS